MPEVDEPARNDDEKEPHLSAVPTSRQYLETRAIREHGGAAATLRRSFVTLCNRPYSYSWRPEPYSLLDRLASREGSASYRSSLEHPFTQLDLLGESAPLMQLKEDRDECLDGYRYATRSPSLSSSRRVDRYTGGTISRSNFRRGASSDIPMRSTKDARLRRSPMRRLS